MRDLRHTVLVAPLVVCLGFTGPAVGWADSPALLRADYIEDPLAPHVTNGTIARLGSSVGFVYGERQDVLALGGNIAIGQRWGRLTIEAEYQYLSFQVKGPSSQVLGDGQRLGVLGRYDILRLGSEYMGNNSMLALYVEGGAAVAWNDWYFPEADQPQRTVAADSKRVEAITGFGAYLDHRLQEPIGFPRRVAWFLGWRMSAAPHDSDPAVVCRGSSCRSATPMPDARYTDRSMLFQSSLAFTW